MFYKVKHIVTGNVTPMPKEVYDKLIQNKNLFVSDPNAEKGKAKMITPFVIVEEVDKHAQNKSERKAFDKKYIKVKKAKFKKLK